MKVTSRILRGISIFIVWGPIVIMSAYSADNNAADLDKIYRLFKQAARINSFPEKATAFENLENVITPYISESLKTRSINEYEALIRLKAMCLLIGSEAFFNCWKNNIELPKVKGLDLLRQSANKARTSQTLFHQNQDVTYEEGASGKLFSVLHNLGEEYFKSVTSQNSSNSTHLTICENVLFVFTVMQESCAITMPSRDSKELFCHTMRKVIRDVLASQIGHSFSDVFKAALMAKNDNDICVLFMQLQKLSTTQKQIIESIYHISNSMSVLSEYQVPESCELISASINLNLCRAKYGLSTAMASRAKESNEISKQKWFQEQAQKYDEEAIKLYRDEIYENQYASNPGREQQFITAQLEDNIGNPMPLGDFYRSMHQERKKERQRQRTVEMIKLQQEQIRKEEEEKAAALESSKLTENEIRQNRNVQVSATSSISTGGHQESTWDQNNSHTTEKYEPPVPKTKIKRNGESKPPLEQSTTHKAEEENNDDPVTKRKLISEHYTTFQSLIGKSNNRNISLASVRGLLGALKCTIQPGGSHGKASGPNGGSWAIPNKDWDGPIPPYYRRQLNDFIQNILEIDPEDVVEE